MNAADMKRESFIMGQLLSYYFGVFHDIGSVSAVGLSLL